MTGELEQQRVQRLALLLVQRSQEVVVHRLDDGTQLAESALALRRDADEVTATVARVALALDQAALLQLVEQSDQMAAVVSERVGDHGLRLRRLLLEQGQNREVRRS